MRPSLPHFVKRLSLNEEPPPSRFRRRGALSFVAVTWQGLVRFLTNAVVGRIGGPLALGSVATVLSFAQLLSLLWATSAGSAASRYVASARGSNSGEAGIYASHLARRTGQATAALVACSFPLWLMLDAGNVVSGIVLCVMFAGYAGYAFTRGLQFGAARVGRATAWDLATGALGLVGVAVALAAGLRGAPVLLPMGAAYLIYAAGNWPARTERRPPPHIRRELDRFVAMGVAGTLASGGFLQSSVLVARSCAGQVGAGLYAAALTLATPGALLASSLTLVLFPSLASAWGARDTKRFRAQTDYATRLLVTVMIAIFGSLTLMSEPLIDVFWGSGYKEAASLLPILLCAVCANTISVACVSAITTRSLRGMAVSMSSSMGGLAVGVVSWAVLVPRLGLSGVAWGYLVGVLVISGVPIGIVWVRDRHRWSLLAFRVAIGALLIGLGLAVEKQGHYSWLADALVCSVFLVAWIGITSSEIRVLYTRLAHPKPSASEGAAL